MSHTYLLSLYHYLESQKQSIEEALNLSSACINQKEFDSGRLSILAELEEFLHIHLDHKLPRNIYRRLKSQCAACQSTAIRGTDDLNLGC